MPFGCDGQFAETCLDNHCQLWGSQSALAGKVFKARNVVSEQSVVLRQNLFLVRIEQMKYVFYVMFHLFAHAVWLAPKAYKK